MKDGDFVQIEYVGRVAGTNEIFDLTNEEVAKSEKIHNEKRQYGPVLAIVGASMVLPGVDKQLAQMSLGEERNFSLLPEEGFGRRSPNLVIVVSLTKFIKEKINPIPGTFVTIDGRQAKIQNVSGGRVRVDLNHPLAGKELNYNLKVVKQLNEPFEKVDALIKYYKINCEIELQGDKLVVKRDKAVGNLLKRMIEEPIKKWVTEIKTVEFVSKEQNKAEEKPKETISEN